MMMIEDIQKDINNSFKEIQENSGKQLEALKRKHKNPLKIAGKHKQTVEVIEQNHLGYKNRNTSNKETIKGDNPGNR